MEQQIVYVVAIVHPQDHCADMRSELGLASCAFRKFLYRFFVLYKVR